MFIIYYQNSAGRGKEWPHLSLGFFHILEFTDPSVCLHICWSSFSTNIKSFYLAEDLQELSLFNNFAQRQASWCHSPVCVVNSCLQPVSLTKGLETEKQRAWLWWEVQNPQTNCTKAHNLTCNVFVFINSCRNIFSSGWPWLLEEPQICCSTLQWWNTPESDCAYRK